ncbi:ATP-binding protein, partial [Thermodesulfobacteriota bacterium]
MDTACDYSKLKIPNDPEYADIAANYVGAIAAKIGFPDEDKRHIEKGIRAAVTSLAEYSFEPGDRASLDVSCERVPQGLKVSIRDSGMPLNEARFLEQSCGVDSTEPGDRKRGSNCITDHWDELVFRNLGKAGKETVLIKHLNNKTPDDYHKACRSELPARPGEKTRPVKGEINYHVRLMEPAEAVEVAKCIYKTYGYT